MGMEIDLGMFLGVIYKDGNDRVSAERISSCSYSVTLSLIGVSDRGLASISTVSESPMAACTHSNFG